MYYRLSMCYLLFYTVEFTLPLPSCQKISNFFVVQHPGKFFGHFTLEYLSKKMEPTGPPARLPHACRSASVATTSLSSELRDVASHKVNKSLKQERKKSGLNMRLNGTIWADKFSGLILVAKFLQPKVVCHNCVHLCPCLSRENFQIDMHMLTLESRMFLVLGEVSCCIRTLPNC